MTRIRLHLVALGVALGLTVVVSGPLVGSAAAAPDVAAQDAVQRRGGRGPAQPAQVQVPGDGPAEVGPGPAARQPLQRPPRGLRSWRPFQERRGVAQEPAFARGYADGFGKGMDDGRDRDRYDPVGSGEYRRADQGYSRQYGPRDAYQTNYRAGFRQGYEEGYRDGARGGRRRRGE